MTVPTKLHDQTPILGIGVGVLPRCAPSAGAGWSPSGICVVFMMSVIRISLLGVGSMEQDWVGVVSAVVRALESVAQAEVARR